MRDSDLRPPVEPASRWALQNRRYFLNVCLSLDLLGLPSGSGDTPQLQFSSFPTCAFGFQLDHFWLLGVVPLPAHSSPGSQVRPDMIFPACEIQSKQQLVLFSSLCCSADPLLKACSSLGRNPGHIPTHCFFDTL